MMAIKISVELEPIVVLRCQNTGCRYNLEWAGFAACNLKHITIGSDGECVDFEPKCAVGQGVGIFFEGTDLAQ